ncbi:MAG: preprotein translocase subunit YajC [Candidatus Sumerlaeota bacterium]|nr:preprotein translocase subunit YajC [Candidatus Sumerlaeota bacterium]
MGDFFYRLAILAQQGGAAAGQGKAEEPGGIPTQMIFMMIAIAVAFYFILLRPQQKEKKERQKQINALAKGDKIITIGGLHGKVTRIGKSGQTVEVELVKNVRVLMNRTAVGSIIKQSKGKEEGKESQEEELE